MRLFFATDIHGSETCWRKFLNPAPHYDADVVDPRRRHDRQGARADHRRRRRALARDAAREPRGARGRGRGPGVRAGGHPPRLLPVPHDARRGPRARRRRAALARAVRGAHAQDRRALDGARRREAPRQGHPCFVCPGNDDQLEVDDVIRQAKYVRLAEGEVVDVDGGFQLASTGWANRTPWDTYREEDEPDLARRIAAVDRPAHRRARADDLQPALPPVRHRPRRRPGADRRDGPAQRGPFDDPRGLDGGAEAIESLQPALSLHGHIHEARGSTRLGRTLCINPGSSYEQGQLLGAVVDVDGKKKVKRFVLTSG